jgi:hypothetical protein
MHAVILKRADHLEAGSVAHVRESWIPVSTEVPLQDLSIRRAVEQRAPRFELTNAFRRFACMQLSHAPVVQILAAAHRVGEVHAPAVTIVHIGERRGHAAFGHYGMCFPEQRLAYEANANALRSRANRCAQSGAAGANDEDVMLVLFVRGH